MILVDGDRFEEHNRQRQDFTRLGPKAQVKAEEFRRMFPRVIFSYWNEYLSPDNVQILVGEGDIVLMAIDKYVGRKVVSDRVSHLDRGAVICGANDLTTGDVMVYLRQNGQDLTFPLANEMHPEILNPEPEDLEVHDGCAVQVVHSPQQLATNVATASHMFNTFWLLVTGQLHYEELFFDIVAGEMRVENYHGAE
jgi:molybdopterin/thiamine biosynthesis adenylyltransferase